LLARTLLELGRLDEADAIADPGLAGDDLKAAIGLLGVRAEIRAARGDVEEAARLAAQAVSLAEPTDALVDHADARLALARVLHASGRPEEAAREHERARALYEEKGAEVRAGAGVVEPTAPAPVATAARIVGRNSAVDAVEGWLAARDRGEWDRVDGFYAEQWTSAVHRVDSVEGEAGTELETPASLRTPEMSVSQEVLAAIGERHCLVRRVWCHPEATVHGSQGASEMRDLMVWRVDGDGRLLRCDTFEGERFADALACLLERWGEDETSEPERARRFGSMFTSLLDLAVAGDWEAFGERFSVDAILVDHRFTGVGAVESRDAIVAWTQSGIGPDSRFTFTDVLRLTPRGSVTRLLQTGRPEGVAYESPSVVVTDIDDGGRMRRLEIYPADALDEALAAFDGLGADETAARRLTPNAASRMMDSWVEGVNRGDLAAVDARRSPAFRLTLHGLRGDIDADGQREREAALINGHVRAAVEHLATLGDRHVLCRQSLRWEQDPDAGESAVERLLVLRVDDDGRALACDLYEPDELPRAIGTLVVRWAEAERPNESARARRVAQGYTAVDAINARDWDTYRRTLGESMVLVDHRETGAGAVRGPDAIIEWFRAFFDLTDAMRSDMTDVLALTPSVGLVVIRSTGEVDGASFDIPALAVIGAGPSGLGTHFELFAVERVDDAWRRFDELVAAGQRSARRVAPNLATALMEAWLTAARDGDASANVTSRSSGFLTQDHELRLELDREQAVAREGVWTADMPAPELLATLGDRHLLQRFDVAVGGERWVWLIVLRVGSDGLAVRNDRFDGDRLVDALACLVDRWAEDELDGAARERAHRIAEGCRSADAAIGPGRLVDVLAFTARAFLWRWDSSGDVGHVTGRFDERGRIVDVAHVAAPEAWARFDALDAGALPRRRSLVVANPASELIAAWSAAFNARDLDRANALRAPGYERIDHHWHHVVDRDTAVALDEVTSVDGWAEIEVMATLGRRHALSSLRFVVADAVTERFITTSVDAEGNQIECDELFGVDALDEALATLQERHAEAEGTPPALVRWAGAPRALRMAVVRGDWDRVRSLLADDVTFQDHRLTGVGAVESAETVVAVLRSAVDDVADND
ncbi:MAG TPA: nuclear transport factor 2 family protein, partial [Acidimicrobiales bacterium]|nr:nuclear transport factor 2 family protein [Acidimicrobiales bacterium]